MSKRESFLLRIDPKLLAALKSWADAEMRSTNSHVEYLLRECLVRSGRIRNVLMNDHPVDSETDDQTGMNG